MLNITYTITDELRKTLSVIEPLRREILLTPIPNRVLHKLRWDALIRRVYCSLTLSERQLTKGEVADTIATHSVRKAQPLTQEITNYRNALSLVSFEWLANPNTVSPKAIVSLYALLLDHTRTQVSTRTLDALKHFLKEFLSYINSSKEHPVLVAGTVYASLSTLPELEQDNGRLAMLGTYLFLYKLGFDVRDLLVIEEPLLLSHDRMKTLLSEAKRSGNLSPWLSFFAGSVYEALGETEKRLASAPTIRETPHIWELTDRQKQILASLSEPGSSVTNKKVQRTFTISQITASRDLARLTTLGLLYPHGKGRSIYYTSA